MLKVAMFGSFFKLRRKCRLNPMWKFTRLNGQTDLCWILKTKKIRGTKVLVLQVF